MCQTLYCVRPKQVNETSSASVIVENPVCGVVHAIDSQPRSSDT